MPRMWLRTGRLLHCVPVVPFHGVVTGRTARSNSEARGRSTDDHPHPAFTGPGSTGGNGRREHRHQECRRVGARSATRPSRRARAHRHLMNDGHLMSDAATIGIDIGGTSVRAAVIDAEGEIRASLRDTTPHTERETEDILVNLITKLAATHEV